MKTFIVLSQTAYGTFSQVVNAIDIEQAEKIALRHGAWDGCMLHEIDTEKEGIVFSETD